MAILGEISDEENSKKNALMNVLHLSENGMVKVLS